MPSGLKLWDGMGGGGTLSSVRKALPCESHQSIHIPAAEVARRGQRKEDLLFFLNVCAELPWN